MNLDLFLSEMSVSDRHGGGLTLQRVLDVDLEKIQLFVNLSRFGIDNPVVDRLASKSLNLVSPFESDVSRRRIGCRPSNWLANLQISRLRQGQRAAGVIASHFANKAGPLRALVCPQNAGSLYTLDALMRLHSVEYISWIMDDHLVRWREGSWCYSPAIEPLFARHLKEAKHVFVISDNMADFYQKRFAIRAEVLMPPADYSDEPVWKSPSDNETIRLGYFGNLGPWATNALNRVVPFVERLGLTLDIYGPGIQKQGVFSSKSVRLCGSVAKADLRNRMREYDALVLPISFSGEERNMSEFNIATRMSEYLASGTITLVIAPEYAAMSIFLRQYSAAIVPDSDTFKDFQAAIKKLKCPEYRASTLSAARKLVIEQLSVAVVRDKWRASVKQLLKN